MNEIRYLLIDPEIAMLNLREKNSRKARVTRALIWHENYKIASKQAQHGLEMNDHERYGGAPKQHFALNRYDFLDYRLKREITQKEFYKAMALLKDLRIAWTFKKVKEGEHFNTIHMWNLESEDVASVFDWNGTELQRNEMLTMLGDFSDCGTYNYTPSPHYWMDLALSQLTD